ncbi:hypothetical protein ACLBX9_18215 [Methylobacterium sp. A49B]
MASTKYKDLAVSTAAAARRKSEGRPARDGTSAVGRRMLLDITEVTTIGFGELLDMTDDVALSSAVALRANAGAVASLTLTLANGDDAKALGLLPVVIGEMERIARERIGADPALRTTGEVDRSSAEASA